MASEASTVAIDDLSLVSSQYGPGPIIGWLLAAFSVFLSWAFETRLDPEHKSSRHKRVNADLIAAIMFPLIAAGDVLLQIIKYPGNLSDLTTTNDSFLKQKIHALEAPLVLVEGAIIVTVPLIATALYKQHMGKAVILGAINICCISAESLLLTQTAMHHCESPCKTLGRSFLPNSMFPFVLVATIIGLYEIVSISLFVLSPVSTSAELSRNRDREEQEAVSVRVSVNQSSIPSPSKNAVASWLRLYLFTTCLCNIFIILGNISGNAASFGHTLFSAASGPAYIKFFLLELFPRTNASIVDLDQMVAVVLGALLLLLNIYQLWMDQHSAE